LPISGAAHRCFVLQLHARAAGGEEGRHRGHQCKSDRRFHRALCVVTVRGCRWPHRCHFAKGPQVGSRMSPALEVRRCLIRPSTLAATSESRPPTCVAYMTQRPFGAKLGDSSRPASERIVSLPPARSRIATRNRPSRRVTYASSLPSGLMRGLTLYEEPKVTRVASPPPSEIR